MQENLLYQLQSTTLPTETGEEHSSEVYVKEYVLVSQSKVDGCDSYHEALKTSTKA